MGGAMSEPDLSDVIAAVSAGVARVEVLVRALSESHPLSAQIEALARRQTAMEAWKRRAIWWWVGGVAVAGIIGGLVGYSLGAG